MFLSLLTLVAVLRKREAWVLAAACAAAMELYYYYETTPRFASTSFEIRTEIASSFLLASAGYFLVKHRVSPFVKSWMPLLALALAFCVNHLAVTPSAVRMALASWPLRMMGIWSYSIYLWQQPFYDYKASLPDGVAVIAAMLTGLASFYLFENPCRNWINKRW